LSPFQKLCVLRTIRPDKLTRAVQIYVENSMGRRYIEPPPFDLEQCFADSSCVTPLVFVLSPGSDPMSGLLKYAESRQVKIESLSLGQGQGAKAEALIAKAAADGSWVVLQNCHLAVSWMTTLERICEAFVTDEEPPHENFRVWLTSYPSPHFPVAVLQNGVKMTNEPPKGMRANMMQSFSSDPISDPDFYEDCARPAAFKKLLVGLAFFHAAIQERIKFGPLGWNIPYGFNDPDLKISLRQLRMFLDESSPDAPLDTPLKTLVYLVGECNYGGRVTDGHDRRTLMSILTDERGGPFHANIMLDDYVFSPSGVFRAPALESREEVLDYFKQLPIAADPEVFGLHANADIAKDQKETDTLLDGVLLTQGASSGGGGKSKEETLKEVAAQISDSLPPLFDLETANYKYPVEYYESMNSVLCQELVRYNRLLAVIHKSIGDFGLALRGRIVMTGELDALGSAMYDGKIPAMWAKKSYPSLKPLAAYVSELLKRLAMLQKWIDEGAPPRFWITGFFFTHAFLTGVLQNFARKRKLPIDSVVFDFKAMPSTADFSKKPEDGAFCHGIFMEGCKWDENTMLLQESDPKVLYTDAPTFWFVPTTVDARAEFPHYVCPIYRTAERRGVLATTGHSSNFVINLTIPSDQPQNHWIKRGVAGLLSLSY
jgi:dynein heavy chain